MGWAQMEHSDRAQSEACPLQLEISLSRLPNTYFYVLTMRLILDETGRRYFRTSASAIFYDLPEFLSERKGLSAALLIGKI